MNLKLLVLCISLLALTGCNTTPTETPEHREPHNVPYPGGVVK